MKKTVLYVLLWLSCTVYTTGVFVAYFQGEYPSIAQEEYRNDLGGGIVMGLFGGPLAAVLVTGLSGFLKHGWTLLPKKPQS